MTAKNDITGDTIKTKGFSTLFDENFDRIFRKNDPEAISVGPLIEICEDLSTLPVEHRLRNTPLFEIGAHYQLHSKGKVWHEVREPYGIAKSTYNQLAPVWIEGHTWRSTR